MWQFPQLIEEYGDGRMKTIFLCVLDIVEGYEDKTLRMCLD